MDLRIPSSDNHYICDVLCTADRCDAYNIIYKNGMDLMILLLMGSVTI
mgnify:CR=1 FL=1